ncbi:hypothetical protein HYX12_04675 [Candidatus Woesearchaeota archaeon]|nr:hypothetical protein [Candidatus Woesearchaeota archaeon]
MRLFEAGVELLVIESIPGRFNTSGENVDLPNGSICKVVDSNLYYIVVDVVVYSTLKESAPPLGTRYAFPAERRRDYLQAADESEFRNIGRWHSEAETANITLYGPPGSFLEYLPPNMVLDFGDKDLKVERKKS